MSQVENTKLSSYIAIGSDPDEETVSKLSLYILVVPGESEAVAPSQTHVYSQKIVRTT